MSVHLVTGYAGEPHVSSSDVGRFNAGVFGGNRFVLETGNMFECTVINQNQVKISNGDLVNQGRHISIPENDEILLSVENGTQGRNRVDVISMRYEKNAETGIETAYLKITKGNETFKGESLDIHEPISGNIFNGELIDEMPLYEIYIEELKIKEVKKVFLIAPSISTILSSDVSRLTPSVRSIISFDNFKKKTAIENGFPTWNEYLESYPAIQRPFVLAAAVAEYMLLIPPYFEIRDPKDKETITAALSYDGVLSLRGGLNFINGKSASENLGFTHHISTFTGTKTVKINEAFTSLLITVSGTASKNKIGMWQVVSADSAGSIGISEVNPSSVFAVEESGEAATFSITNNDTGRHSVDILVLSGSITVN